MPSEATATDESELLRRAARDPDAFAALYRLHHAAIARHVERRVGDPHLADDLVADTFTLALQHLERFEDRGLPFRSWLFRLASTAIGRWARSPRRRLMARLEDEPAEPAAETSPAVEIARTALLALPERYQTTLALHYLEGLSVAEIAAVAGCCPGTVKARLSRGRALLRHRLQPHVRELFR